MTCHQYEEKKTVEDAKKDAEAKLAELVTEHDNHKAGATENAQKVTNLETDLEEVTI